MPWRPTRARCAIFVCAASRTRSPTMDATGMDVDAPYAAAEPSDATTQDGAPIAGQIKAVSYTHLTLPTKA